MFIWGISLIRFLQLGVNCPSPVNTVLICPQNLSDTRATTAYAQTSLCASLCGSCFHWAPRWVGMWWMVPVFKQWVVKKTVITIWAVPIHTAHTHKKRKKLSYIISKSLSSFCPSYLWCVLLFWDFLVEVPSTSAQVYTVFHAHKNMNQQLSQCIKPLNNW